jgi:hypothetical protein
LYLLVASGRGRFGAKDEGLIFDHAVLEAAANEPLPMNRRTELHPLFGEIPLVEKRSVGLDGREYTWFERDPAFMPPLPAGAVRGDVSEQDYCPVHHVPKYFYIDEQRTCVQCGRHFVFSAEEQKFWYETLKFNFGSDAIRCIDCRRRKRTEKDLREEVATAMRDLKSRPKDHHVLIDLARALVMYREMTGEGSLEKATAACRKARKEWPLSHEALFWEAKCQNLAGRREKARELFTDFIAAAGADSHLAKLVREAKAEVRKLSTLTRPTS